MIMFAINFSLHFLAWRGFNMRYYWADRELRVFHLITLELVALCTTMLVLHSQYTDYWQALRYATINVISIITTTGFVTANFSEWTVFLPVRLMLIAFIGGCAGSSVCGL